MCSLFGKLFLVASALLLVTSYASQVATAQENIDQEDLDRDLGPAYDNEVDIDIETGFSSEEESERHWRNYESAQTFAKEFRVGNTQHVRGLLNCANNAGLTLDELGLSAEEQTKLYQEAKRQALPDLQKWWKELQAGTSSHWTISSFHSYLRIYRISPEDIGTTEATLEKIERQAVVKEALENLQRYEQDLNEFSLSDFCSTVEIYSLSARELGLPTKRLKELRHLDAVNQARSYLDSLPGRPRSTDVDIDIRFWYDFPKLQQLIADGVTFEEIGISEREWQKLSHGYDVDQATGLLEQARANASQELLTQVKQYLTKGVTLEELRVAAEEWEAFPYQFDVEHAREALRRCKADDSPRELTRLEQLLGKGVTLEEVGLTQKKLDALRDYIRAVNE